MNRRGAFGSIALSGMLAAGLSGTAAAQAEDELIVLCTPEKPYCEAMVAAFQEQTGIPTAYQRMSSGESLVRLQAGAAAPEFDVWWGGPADGQIAAGIEGLVEPYISPNAAAIAEGQKAEDGTWTGVYVGALGFCSNTELLDELGVEAPDSWEDLLDPKLDDNVQVAHPASSGTAYTTFYTQVSRFDGDEEAALDYMGKLHDNILYYTKSGAAPGRNAGGGEVAVAIIFSHDCINNIEQGMPLVVSFPSEGTGYEIAGQSLVANAPHPNNAKTWIDWALTGPAQEIGWRDPNAGAYQLPTNPDAEVSDQAVNIAELELVEYDFDAAGAARQRLTEQFENEIATEGEAR
jgi:iron(III) transport system substrate-binding protein